MTEFLFRADVAVGLGVVLAGLSDAIADCLLRALGG
jgi:hypothetical protein